MSLTYRETKQQYAALRHTYEYMLGERGRIEAFVKKVAPSSLTYLGCGSSYCLCESAAFSVRLRAGLTAQAFAGGDLLLNGERYRPALTGTLLVAPSRSGSTTEIVEAVRRLRGAARVPLLAVSCVADSPLSAEADLALELPWAFDASVCQTRTVINLYTANLLIAAILGGDEALIASIDAAIRDGEAYMARVEAGIRAAAGFDWTQAVVLADGELKGLAGEGAIALTEIAAVQAQSYHLLDVRHGPMVVVGPGTLVIAAASGEAEGAPHRHNLLRDLKRRGATVIVYGDEADPEIEAIADYAAFSGRPLDPAAQGIPFLFLSQIAALSRAERKGIDPDQPDGLVAWVEL
ncbi:glucosamine--fructose-6-phosphate aminotransferase (isomerizing) [Cohnella sp. OV330]|uniref:SIS domain-containing protein n=1 Tax=Cohnella sp. OV330 TaxID=1855288 RepID=UPI0008E772BE|nr:SIS domain-containing protein [Cohnella sp. OV330]SFA79751.1 glucosamine--fructose-6-phosphate aminotransferase (isomerizing) [Cohnella sp. OV330]